MADEKGFTAKKEIPAQEIDVESARVVISPPQTVAGPEGDIEKPATINFNISGVKPIEITAKELDIFWKWAIPIAGRAPNLKDITPETSLSINP